MSMKPATPLCQSIIDCVQALSRDTETSEYSESQESIFSGEFKCKREKREERSPESGIG